MTQTQIANLDLSVCLMNASGCWCTTEDELNQLDGSVSGCIVTKSSTLEKREGNPEPRFKQIYKGTVNSMGIPNLGFDFYNSYKNVSGKPCIQSVTPFTKEELCIMLKDVNRTVELNLSCPNLTLKSNTVVAYDYEQFESYLDVVKNTKDVVPVGLKLPPYYESHQFDAVSNIINRCGYIKFVTSVNSICNGLVIDAETESTVIKPKDGFGGVGGLYCKPTGLSNVRQLFNRIGDTVDVIGCGGVSTGLDAFEYILCGSSAVQIGSALIKEGPSIFDRVNKELLEIMSKKRYDSIYDFVGKLKLL